MLILGIESSCDETAAAVVSGSETSRGAHVLSNVIATQHDLHERYAGVVPEIASRAHLERITPVIREALERADVSYQDLNAIAVGNRPGLIGSLIVGVSAAKALAWSLEILLIGIDHIHAHLYSGVLDGGSPALRAGSHGSESRGADVAFPALGLVVSGGHTSLFLLKNWLDITLIGRTIDDAIGEAYDKAATILELGYPGGPKLDKLAQLGNDQAHDFPISMLDKTSLDFSFSGLKTSLLYAVRGQPQAVPRRSASQDTTRSVVVPELTELQKADFAASFQRAAVTAIIRKVRRALKVHKVRTLLTGGGVTANSRLRRELTDLGKARDMDVRLPRIEYCLDNAAMIAGLATERYRAKQFDDLALSAAPR